MTTDTPTICYQCGDIPWDHGCPTCDALQALADVRTLDAWAQENKKPASCVPVVEMGGSWRLYLTHAQTFLGSTPDEARAKAAAWVRGLK